MTDSRDDVTAKYEAADQAYRTQNFASTMGFYGSSEGFMGLIDEVAKAGDTAMSMGLHPLEYQAALQGVSTYDLACDVFDSMHGPTTDPFDTTRAQFVKGVLDDVASMHGMAAGEYFNVGSKNGWGGPGTKEYEAAMRAGVLVGMAKDEPFNTLPQAAMPNSAAAYIQGIDTPIIESDESLSGKGAIAESMQSLSDKLESMFRDGNTNMVRDYAFARESDNNRQKVSADYGLGQ